MLCSDRADRLHFRAFAVEMNRYDCLGAGCHGSLDLLGIDQRILLTDIDEHRARSTQRDTKAG